MKKFSWKKIISWGILAALLCGLGFAFLRPSEDVLALPEYSAQTGEPCASCHISPSGGGARGPRGQAWVGSGKPGVVPDLFAALEVLGVELQVEESNYTIVPETIPAARPLPLDPGQVERLHEWLQDYQGN